MTKTQCETQTNEEHTNKIPERPKWEHVSCQRRRRKKIFSLDYSMVIK